MNSRILETRIAQVAVFLSLAGATIRVLHLFSNNSIGYILLATGLVLMAVAVVLRSRHNKQLGKRNGVPREKTHRIKHK